MNVSKSQNRQIYEKDEYMYKYVNNSTSKNYIH